MRASLPVAEAEHAPGGEVCLKALLTAAKSAAIEAAEDVVAQVMLSHHLGDFAVTPAAQEGLEYGGHAAADVRFGAEG